MNDPQIFSNAMIVTADDVFSGYVVVQDGKLLEVGKGRAPEPGRDLGGDYLMPGLIEIHTDNLEAHYMPRPRVEWNVASAVMSYDAQIATSGITTVFDSLRIGIDEHETRAGFGSKTIELADEIARASTAGYLRADHLTHIRCEVPAPNVVDALDLFIATHPVHLMSLMDHTPGQRQFRDIEKYFIYYGGKTGKTDEEVRAVVSHRQTVGAARASVQRSQVVELARKHAIPLASHDDTTIEEVTRSISEGVTIAEFPTTIEAAAVSKEAGMATVLAEEGHLDILSSDYVPASLLLAAMSLADVPKIGGLPGAIRLVSRNVAEATGLHDRGEIAVGKRADLIRVTKGEGSPVVREVLRGGIRVA
jgi:alpha-D-ribose 1-methylphosphonate 5-triphosphate diphosphatase